jgi:predicted phosphodiesterase
MKEDLMTTDRFLIWSDIHEEFEDLALPDAPPENIDAILVAGDIWTKGRAVRKLDRIAEWAGVPIIATAGNHDYYGTSMAKGDEYFSRHAAASPHDIRFLNPGCTVVGGCRIVAATLWTDYRLRRPEGDNFSERQACENVMNDHRAIRWGYGNFRRVSPEDLASVHRKHKDYIRSVLAIPFDGPTLVMTHHAPAEHSVRHGDGPTLVDHAYASNLEDLIHEYAPEIWVHGHTHHQEDYQIGSTRILANAKGYPDQENGFELMRVYEVEVNAPSTEPVAEAQ